MEGYLVTFFTQRNREYQGVSLAKWIVEKAKETGVRGATLIPGKEGFGHDGRFHSDSIFDCEDSPLQVVMAMTFDEYDRLMTCIERNKVRVFYVKAKAEFGYTTSES
jgi:PII-like signaling protein